jgi:hypothetical protein
MIVVNRVSKCVIVRQTLRHQHQLPIQRISFVSELMMKITIT